VSQSTDPEPIPRERMLASDADREVVVERLRQAHDDGRLSIHEYDERVRSAYASRTYGDLALLTADLPGPARPPAVPAPAPITAPTTGRPQRRHTGDLVWRIVGSTWFGVSVLNLLIWAIVCIATTSWVYPWWIWVAGPWGAILAAGWLTGLGRSRGQDG
jgi:Domain of unknown function (DUF1707)